MTDNSCPIRLNCYAMEDAGWIDRDGCPYLRDCYTIALSNGKRWMELQPGGENQWRSIPPHEWREYEKLLGECAPLPTSLLLFAAMELHISYEEARRRFCDSFAPDPELEAAILKWEQRRPPNIRSIVESD